MDHLEVQVLEHGAHGQAGVVYHDVYSAKAFYGSINQRKAVGLGGDVAANRKNTVFRSHRRRKFQQFVV